jgi:hypothetical protein
LAHLLRTHIRSANEDAPYHAPVAILALLLHVNRLAKDHIRERLFGALTEGLRFLRRIDLGKTHLNLPVAIYEHGDRIAIGDAHDCPFKR